MKAIGYVRVSTENQDDGERQVKQINSYGGTFNIEIVEIFKEVESGLHKERPVLTKMMNKVLSSDDIDFVIVSEISRLGRTSKVLETIEILTEAKIGLISIQDKIQTLDENKKENAMSKLAVSFLASINGFELDTLKARVISGIKSKRIDGHAAGSLNIPFGYRKEKNKMLVVDEEEAKTIQLIFNLYKEGKGTKVIANYLNENNYETRTQKIIKEFKEKGIDKEYKFKQKWVDGTVYSILNNTIYIGQRKHAKNKLDGYISKKDNQFKKYKRPTFEYEFFDHSDTIRIISDELFTEVQDRMKDNVNKLGHNIRHNYLLDNKKIVCGICGQSYFPHKRTSGKDNRYICLSVRYNEQDLCGNVGISIDKVDRLIQAVVLDKFDDILLNNLTDNSLKEDIDQLQREIEQLNIEYKKEQQREVRIITSYSNGDYSDHSSYLMALKPIQFNKESILNKIKLNEEKLNTSTKAFTELTDLKKIERNFNRKGVQLPRTIVNSILTKLVLTKIESAPIEFQEVVKQIPNYAINKIFQNKQDKFILATIVSGVTELHYLLSQREDFIFDFQESKIKQPFAMGFKGWSMYLPIKKINQY